MKMRILSAAWLFCLWIMPAFAQSTATPVITGYLTTVGCPTGQTSCFVQFGGASGGVPIPTIPPKLTTFGYLSVTTSSVALSTLTITSPNPAWTTAYPSNYVSIRNSIASSGTVFVCWLGGTCSATVGEPIAQGETVFRNPPSGTAITLYSTLGATVFAEE